MSLNWDWFSISSIVWKMAMILTKKNIYIPPFFADLILHLRTLECNLEIFFVILHGIRCVYMRKEPSKKCISKKL